MQVVIQPMIMDTVSVACSQLFVMLNNQHRAQQQPVAQPADNAILSDMRSQLRRQSYSLDQKEQDNRSDNIRIKGVDYEAGEDLQQKIIDVAKEADVTLEREDIVNCYRLGDDDKPANRRPIMIRVANRGKKVSLMRNKKKLPREKYFEEDLTKVRTKIFYAVRKHEQTTKAWTVEGKIFAMIKDNTNTEHKKIFTTPDDLQILGWDMVKINNYMEAQHV